MNRLFSLALGAALFAGCTDPATQAKLTDLEARVAKLEENASKPGAAQPGKPATTPEDEAAIALYRQANEASRNNQPEEAKKILEDLLAKYGSTKVAEPARRLMAQLSVVGKEITELQVESWVSGQSALSEGKATLLVFWEVWCPHCKEEVPKLQETYTKYKGQGLNLIGLTKMTKGKTLEDVKAFISEKGVTYPVGKESGTMSEFFGVSGVPAAAVVKGGKVVWRGHPAQITEAMITGWLSN